MHAPSALVSALNWRYATKRFDTTRNVPAHELRELLEALRLSPSSFGLQPWKFVLVEDPALREKIRALAWNQSQITDASHIVVICASDTTTEDDVDAFVDRIAATRNVPKTTLAGYRDMMLGFVNSKDPAWLRTWADRQAYIALGTILTSAAILKIDACPMEGFDAAALDALLGLSGVHSLAIVALGYRHPEDTYANLAKVRHPADRVIETR